MKNTILLIFFLVSVNLFSQKPISSGVINYIATLNIDQEKIKKSLVNNTKANEMAIVTIKNSGKVNFKLKFTNHESIFTEDKNLEIEENKFNLTKILTGKGIIYTNKASKEILNQKEEFGEVLLIAIPTVKWNLTQETKKIGNYICFKATAEKEFENERGKFIKKIVAWYTPELLINFGPKEYFGLPGLILELQEGKLFYKASKIDLSAKTNIKIKEPVKGKKITLEQFNKMIKEMVKNYR